MTNDASPVNMSLLSLCAILRWFDQNLLVALSEYDEGNIAALLTSDYVESALEPGGAYHLRKDVQMEALAQLQAYRPLDELMLHTHAFQYFLRQIEQKGPTARRLSDEVDCFYHLDKLFFLLSQRLEWQTMAEYVSAARAASPQQTQHLHQLSLYDGYISIRMQNYDRGEALLRALLEQDDLGNEIRIRALNGLAQAYQYQSHYDRALVWYQQLHSLAREAGALVYQGVALLNMGMIYNDLDYYDRALDLSMQSLQIFRELHDSSREMYALYHVGNNAMRLGRWQMAQSYYDEAITLCETLGITALLAFLYWGQGFIYHLLGDEPQSERAYLRALEISQSSEHGDPTLKDDVFLHLGFLYQTQEHWEQALAAYEQAIELAGQLRREHWLSLIHYRRGNVFQRQGRTDDAFAAYREAIEGIESLRSSTEVEEIKIGLLGTTQQVYESMVLLCLDQDCPAEAFDYVERARSRAFLDTLIKKSPELYAAVAQPVATLQEVQARLPAGALLLEYFTTGVLPTGEHLIHQLPKENTRLRQHLTLPPTILIFAVTHDRLEVHRATLDPNVLRPRPDDPSSGRRLLHERMLMRLEERLIGPVRHLLHGRDLLYLIPHGPLHSVPFMALRSAAGAYLLAADGPAIALAPSATVLLRNCLSRPKRRTEGLLALGYNDADERALRYAEAEAQHVARLLAGQAWVGPEPKSRRLLDEGQTVGRLHIAGHAIYDLHDPLESHLRLGAGDQLSAHALIAGLEFDADLVTLSACTSGLAHVVAGDELLGLQRAFLYAGAAAVVCTLWETFDFVALLVMDRFYTDLRQGLPTAAALRDAQVAVRSMTGRDVAAIIARWRAEDPQFIAELGALPDIPPDQYDTLLYADPFYWAPFMLIGRPD